MVRMIARRHQPVAPRRAESRKRHTVFRARWMPVVQSIRERKMTIKEIEDSLPNGFHDALIRKIQLDFEERLLTIELGLLVDLPEDNVQCQYRNGTLRVFPLYLFFADPPYPGYHFIPNGSPLNATGYPAEKGQNRIFDEISQALPADASVYRFFLDDWNSFLYIAGAGAEFCWDSD